MSLQKILRQHHAACRRELARDVSVQDLCENVLLPSDTVYEIAAKAILHFGVTEGCFNNQPAAIILALGFLEECTGIKRTETGMRDLKMTLDATPTFEAIEGWARSHF